MMNEIVYKSIFKEEIQNLIDLKKGLGFDYGAQSLALKRLDHFICQNNVVEKVITKSLCDLWCKKRSYETQANQSNRISTLRVFCKYLTDIGLEAYIPPKSIVGKHVRYNAHIYSDDEIRRFFKAVDESESVKKLCPYRSEVMPIFFRILYTSGMRVSELRLAKLKDINLEDGYITVRKAKNHKERIVPIHPTLVHKCRELKKLIHEESSEDEYFFMIRRGTPMTLQNLYKNFRKYLEKANISHTGNGPRIHDFRHTYCVNLLRKWVEEGKDLSAYMPYMRTMLGHETFEETAYYLKLTAERYPYIKDRMAECFPNLIKEAIINEDEFY